MATHADSVHPACKVVLSKNVANSLVAEVQEGVKTLEKPPHLVGFLANDDPAALMYAQWTEKTCQENGFRYSLRQVSRDDIEDAILAANADSDVDGIIVYYPIFNNRQDQYLQQIVDVSKDVEGLSHRYIFNMYQNIRFLDPETKRQKCLLPCTPLAIIKILEYLNIYNTILPYGNRLFGHTICVVNRSEVVGRPLAALLANDGACVYSVDITGVQKFTREGLKKRRHEVVDLEGKTIKDVAPLCDVVITGVPSESYKFDTSLLREGAVCVNFSSEKNFGPEVKEKASIFVPSIGKVTIVVLLRNLLRLIQNRRLDDVRPAEATERPGTLEAAS
ncbi:methylenetetrahydrofolate dehydrogenase (NAD(+)) [Aspergillus novofumigatus IBT 16806]|uniref:Methylenetetrahydrofolate dehydrogenase [NAD(+)] n=1 Tax=Aspergillus novofumigatus (strain IBT 16806) TaxID=1392255 RepID=A0A2I1C0C6_ASPN1|nr:methylenetetrahydrofolate dehydrogenase [Aspergillus novofumigatus IBT 16806]PKX91043.1 methylenetetrahydrofolate dehydrogenase [Aspergillus novofumigatus IBT 16806]